MKFGGLRFLEAAHVKDVLSVLRWIENARDRVAGFRALRLVPGIGPATAIRCLNELDQASNPVDAMRMFKIPTAAAEAWSSLLAVSQRLNAPTSTWPAEFE